MAGYVEEADGATFMFEDEEVDEDWDEDVLVAEVVLLEAALGWPSVSSLNIEASLSIDFILFTIGPACLTRGTA